MKQSNKLKALISIALVIITMTTSVITAYAYPTFKSGPYNVNKIFLATTQSGTGGTEYNGASAEYIGAFIVAAKVDKNGNGLNPDMKESYAYNAKHSGGAKISCTGTSNKYTKVTCTHGAQYKGYSLTSSNSVKSF